MVPTTALEMYTLAREGFRRFDEEQDDAFLAISSIALIAHLRDWWRAERDIAEEPSCPNQRHLWDVVNGAKHMNLRKLDKLGSRRTYGKGPYGIGSYGDSCFFIETDHGMRDLASVLRETLNWWSVELGGAKP